VIRELARRTGGPVFEPHVTLLGEGAGGARKWTALARKLAGACLPVTLKAVRLCTENDPYRALYLAVRKTHALAAARRAAARHARRGGKVFRPHLSLCYGSVPRGLFRRMRGRLRGKLPFLFRVDELRLMATRGLPAAWRPVSVYRRSRADVPS
jgi:2'-5' RNA ligase